MTEALGAAAQDAGVHVVINVEEREPHAATIYDTTLYLGPDGRLLGKHRKLMPTGSERTVWGMGDGSTLPVVDTPYGRLSGLTCRLFDPTGHYNRPDIFRLAVDTRPRPAVTLDDE